MSHKQNTSDHKNHKIIRISGESVCTVSTRSWVEIPLEPTFYMESRNLNKLQ